MATVAPVVVSLAIWFITKSAFALVFAALGPAVAIASLADARIQSRRRLRREEARFRSELGAARAELAAAHERERGELAETLPSARRLVDATWSEPERWLSTFDSPVLVGVGAGERASTVVLEGAPVATRARGDAHDQLRSLLTEAGTLRDAPLVVDARLGIGISGAAVPAASVARGIALQLLASFSPAGHSVRVETDDRDQWSWLEQAPHGATFVGGSASGASASASGTVIRIRPRAAPPGSVGAGRAGPLDDSGRELVLAVADEPGLLPAGARVLLAARGVRSSIEQHPERTMTGPLRPQLVSREEAIAVVRAMAAHAARSGFAESALPDVVDFEACGPKNPNGQARGSTLAAVVAVTASEPLLLDLVAQGPHAVVGGTTGSGKSELLTAWILAIAHDHPPTAASVLLVDFKGGSAFAALEALPHCVGMITDLDEVGAQRALESLSAELRRRERHLARASAKSIDALPDDDRLPRLVIVVDEFAAMVSGFPELHALFADIAARGRSLGVHLILCTQRPAGVIRDSVLANSALRLSLRVNNRADSTAVIGTDAAASLPAEPRGRAFVSADGAAASLAQFPLVVQGDIDRVAERWKSVTARPHRPWLDPLPATVALCDVRERPHDGIPFGLLDDPADQSQPVAAYDPRRHGNLLVVGAAASGKSTVLATLAASAAVQRVPTGIEGAWDALVALAAEIRGAEPGAPAGGATGAGLDEGPPQRLVLLDDLDALLARFPEEYEGAVLELVTQGLREGPARGIHWALTAQRLTPALHPAVGLCGSRLLLRLPNRQEHVLAGGDGTDFTERLPPGAGRWQGLRLQCAAPEAEPQLRSHADRRHAGRSHADRTHAGRSHADPTQPDPTRADPTHADPTQPDPTRADPTRAAPALDGPVPLAVVSSRPADFVARLRRAFPRFAEPGAVVEIGAATTGVSVSRASDPHAVVGDVDAWQAQWGALAAARSTHTVIVDGCAASEFRAVTRLRALPPVIDGARGEAFWLLERDGSVKRATLRPD